MARCAVINIETNILENTIIAEPTDIPPAGCKLVEIPDGYYWDGGKVAVIPPPIEDPSQA